MFRTNREFYEYAIALSKLPYDTQLLQTVSQMFYNAVAELEKDIDFLFQRKLETFTLREDEDSINLPYVKKIRNIINKTTKQEIKGLQVAELLNELTTTKGAPKYFIYSNGKVFFNTKANRDYEIVIDYDRYYYPDPEYIGDDKLHPIITESPELVEKALLKKIYEYAENYEGLKITYQMTETMKRQEQANQQLRKFKKTPLIINYRRY